MRLAAIIATVSALGLAACDETMTSTGGFGAGGGDGALSAASITVADAGLRSLLDSATGSGGQYAFAYYTDAVSDQRVLSGADAQCGGPGRASIDLQRGDRNGRAYHVMNFVCR